MADKQLLPEGPAPARIMLVGDAPGEQEAATGRPFSGFAGQELSRMLLEAGIQRNHCFVTNLIRIKPPGGDIGAFIALKKSDVTTSHIKLRDKYVMPCVRDGLELLKREIELCKPTIIFTFGNAAWWALTGNWSVVSWRGSIVQTDLELGLGYQPKVLATYPPATILRMWTWRPFLVHDLKRGAREAAVDGYHPPHYEFITRPVLQDTLYVLHQLYMQAEQRPGKLAVDLETRSGHIACIGIAWSKLHALCIPFMAVDKPDGYWDAQSEAQIVFALYQLLTHPNVEVIGQNFSYDIQYFWRHWHFLPNFKRDTMLSQHCMFPNMPKGLDVLASLYCEHYVYWKGESKEWDGAQEEDTLWTYNCKDAVITFEVDEAQQKSVDHFGLREVHDFQQKLFWPVVNAMFLGLKVDHSLRAAKQRELEQEIEACSKFFEDVLGHPLNPRSSPQMKKLFYEDLRQKEVINRKTGSASCDDEALRKIAEREVLLKPLCEKISEQRSLGVLLNTFVTAPTDIDGRMRCSFNIGGTETFRFSSSENAFGSGMNMQNVPPFLRNFYIPDPDNTFFDIDLNSADLRIVVWESDEKEYKAMLREGKDPYTEIAKEFYKDPTITKKDPRRQIFKSFAHGTHYLGTAKGLAERLGLGVHEAEQTQKWYFGRFPGIRKWHQRVEHEVRTRRSISNAFGYRIPIIDRIEGTLMNQCVAWIPQSTVACLINRAFVNIYDNLKQVQVLLQVHDSLAGQFPTALGDEAIKQIVQQASIEIPYPGDPLIIPVGVKTSTKSWGDCA